MDRKWNAFTKGVFMASHIESQMDKLLIEERLSKPKPLKVTDGVSRVGIVVDSITNLGERAKKALNLPQSVCISIKTQDNKPMILNTIQGSYQT